MTIAAEFAYLRPQTLSQALEILATQAGKVMVLAGGTDLVTWLRDDIVEPDLLVDIKRIPGLDQLTDEDGSVSIGALVTFADVIRSGVINEKLPVLAEMAATVGSTGIRNRATVVGNICSAVPSCDAGPVLLAYDAEVNVMGVEGGRQVSMADWFIGPKHTALQRHELVMGVTIPVPEERHGAAFVRLSRYQGEDLAQSSVAIVAMPGYRYRVAFGAVAATPRRAPRIEKLLDGKPLSDALVSRAKKLVSEEIAPITDIRASREYRLRMSEVMLGRGLLAAAERLENEGPAYGTRLM